MEYKIETDLNNETHLIQYNNDDGTILLTDTLENCKSKLKQIIKSRHRVTNISFTQNEIIDHQQGDKRISCKDFCNF